MKLAQLQEARYHNTPTYQEVVDKLKSLRADPEGSVDVTSVRGHQDQYLTVQLSAYTDDAKYGKDQIHQFAKQHNIPYDTLTTKPFHRIRGNGKKEEKVFGVSGILRKKF